MASDTDSGGPMRTAYDAIVVGSGPNGLAAAVELARRGRSVLVVEAHATPGGGCRTLPLTLPGFHHDVCSSIHPMGIASPFFRTLPLAEHGLEWVHPELPLAHPLDDGSAAVLDQSVAATAVHLGRDDGRAYRRLMEPLTAAADGLFADLLGPARPPRHPLAGIRLGWWAARSARGWAGMFHGERARALVSGLAAHSVLPLERAPSAAIAMMLAIAGHASGWPAPRGGAQGLTDALISYLKSLGGEVVTGRRVGSLAELPTARAVLLDLSPRGLLALAGERLPALYRRQLRRYRFGPGVFKVDWALSDPIPWRAAECRRAGTVHVGGTFAEVAVAERAPWYGRTVERPFVLVTQPSVFDPTRAPSGRHTAWGYCHVPPGCRTDMTEPIEAQVERFAPGFRDCVLARATRGPAQIERDNPNCVGGDITGGAADFSQLFTRPAVRLDPYMTPDPALFLCSASTPPGGGVHGMCGYFAARSALRRLGRNASAKRR